MDSPSDDEIDDAISKMVADGRIQIRNNVVSLPVEEQGSLLCSIQIYRRPDGLIRSQLAEMLPGHIEGSGDTIEQRFLVVADWCDAAAASFRRQAKCFNIDEDEVS